ncbi:MAG: Na+/H+ antiporter NhaA [Polyangiaceae bacterium]
MSAAPRQQGRGRVLFAVIAPFHAFFRLEVAGGMVMIASAVVALVWANSPLRSLYDAVFHASVEMKIAGRGISWSVHHFTNDALMTLFFVVAGLEIKRELTLGELSTWRRAVLPLVAAAGGMLVPAGIYLLFNPDGPGHAGWGVPMATDIAFALGCLSLVRKRVPTSVFVFLTALAIFDDLGAILVIALFYGGQIDVRYLALAALLTGALLWLARQRVQSLVPYAVLGVLLWAAVLGSGIHATVAGVVLGLCMPTTPSRPPREVLDDLDVALTSMRQDCDRRGAVPDGAVAAIERHLESVQSPLSRALHGLHAPVAFVIVPLFALANAGVVIDASVAGASPVALGAFFGLVAGKPIGVFGTTWLATRFGLAPRPTGSTTWQLFGASVMAGIGFTMSLFVGGLALGTHRALEDQAKLGVLAASVAAARLGMVVLRARSTAQPGDDSGETDVVLDVPRFAPGYAVLPCAVGPKLLGQSLAALDIRKRFEVSVIGRWPAGAEGGVRKLQPVTADEPLRAGETLLVAGAEAALAEFERFALPPLPSSAPPAGQDAEPRANAGSPGS